MTENIHTADTYTDPYIHFPYITNLFLNKFNIKNLILKKEKPSTGRKKNLKYISHQYKVNLCVRLI